jgi:transposase
MAPHPAPASLAAPLWWAGRPPLDQRILINGILWKFRCNQPWRAIPSRYGSHESCYQHYKTWQSSDLLKQIFAALMRDLQTRGRFNFAHALSSGMLRVLKKGGKVTYYILPEYAEDWRVSTSLLFYQRILRPVKK